MNPAENGGQVEDDNIPPETSTIIACISYSGGFLGAAVYHQQDTTVQIVQDVSEDSDFRSLNSFLYKIQPTLIIANSSQDLQLIHHLNDLCGVTRNMIDDGDASISIDQTNSIDQSASNHVNDEEDEDTHLEGSVFKSSTTGEKDLNGHIQPEQPPSKRSRVEGENDQEEGENEEYYPELRLMPNLFFNYEKGLQRVGELFESEAATVTEHELVVKFRINTKARNMIRAFGALLKHMDVLRIGVEYHTLDVRTPITRVRSIQIDSMVEMDRDTYLALEILSPTSNKRKTRRRRGQYDLSAGLTLFDICNRCKSAPGRNLLRMWFEHPTQTKETLVARQRAIAYFIQDCNLNVTGNVRQCLGKIRSLKAIIKNFRSGRCSIAQWKHLQETLINLVAIGKNLMDSHVKLALLSEYMDAFGDSLEELATVLTTVIDFPESEVENRIVIKLGIDNLLDEDKLLFNRLPRILTKSAREEAERLEASSCSVTYLPMMGYLLAVPSDFPFHEIPDLELIFSNEDTVHLKSNAMHKLDQDLGDVRFQIIDKESVISSRLRNMVIKKAPILLQAGRAAATLDAIISLTITARDLSWCCPTLVDQPCFDAVGVVHPMAQAIVGSNKFVSNSFSSGGDANKIKIFTGPNSCGKSVYLKQVGILAFLAHIGSFVPARSAVIGRVNRIMTRMFTVDLVLDGMSTFATDLSQVSLALRRGDKHSLIIVDEFGKGTLTEVGLSLLSSSLNYWIAKGDDCPHVLTSSHFHALPSLLHLNPNIVSFKTMEVVRTGNHLQFRYRVIDGIVDTSHAAYTASNMGIENSVVERAYKAYEILCAGGNLQGLGVNEELTEMYSKVVSLVGQVAEDWIYSDLSSDGLLDRVSSVIEELGNADGYVSEVNNSDHSAQPDVSVIKDLSVNPTNTEEDTVVTTEVSTSTHCGDRSTKTNRRDLSVSFLLRDELRPSQIDLEINNCSPVRELNITALLEEPSSSDNPSSNVSTEPRSVASAVFVTPED